MILGFGNNLVSSLASDITASQTAISVMPGDGPLFSTLLTSDFSNKSTTLKNYAKITLTDAGETAFEICHLISVSGDTLTVIRGQEGTAAKGWSLKDVIANFATRGSENIFPQIAHIQSGFYTSGIAGGTANALTLELPSTFFLNGSVDWVLKTPLVVYPSQNNTAAATLQLTMGGKVLGTFPLYKGNKAQLVANDILKDVGLVCLLDNSKTFFNVANPGAIYAGLGTAAYRDVTTSASDPTPGRVLKVGDGGLLGSALSVTDANLADKNGLVSMLFKQGNGSGSSEFGGYGCGAHLLYGDSGDGSQVLSANIFIDSTGVLSVEWLAIKKADGSIATKILNKVISSAGGTITGNSSPLVIRNSTQKNALYLLARDQDNTNKWYIGNGLNGSSTASFTNYLGGNSINLNEDGTISINGKTRIASAIEIATTSSNSFRSVYGNYGTFWRQDGSNLYLMLTNSGDQYGGYNSLRPFAINLPTGAVTIGKLGLLDYGNFDVRYQAKGSYAAPNTASKAANGWWQDASTGMIYQWVQGAATTGSTNVTVTFPKTFPGACLFVSVSTLNVNNNDDAEQSFELVSKTNSNCVVKPNLSYGSKGNVAALVWAVGY
jgi:hypothetical protein